MLLFLNNTSRISAACINENGSFELLWEVRGEMASCENGDLDREEFRDSVHKLAVGAEESASVPQGKPASYFLNVTTRTREAGQSHQSPEKSPLQQRWLVAQEFGFSREQDADFRELESLPVCGVAVRLDQCQGKKTGSLYCSLPLPTETGLPLSVNGRFALDSEGRSALFQTKQAEKVVFSFVCPIGETVNLPRTIYRRQFTAHNLPRRQFTARQFTAATIYRDTIYRRDNLPPKKYGQLRGCLRMPNGHCHTAETFCFSECF